MKEREPLNFATTVRCASRWSAFSIVLGGDFSTGELGNFQSALTLIRSISAADTGLMFFSTLQLRPPLPQSGQITC